METKSKKYEKITKYQKKRQKIRKKIQKKTNRKDSNHHKGIKIYAKKSFFYKKIDNFKKSEKQKKFWIFL